jgi:U3 small nucleolar RNA-associated protein 15
MAADVLPLAQIKLPAGPSAITAEQRYWKTFKNPKAHTSTASWAVSHISFPRGASSNALSTSLTTAPKSNDLFAVTAGPRVDVFSIRKRELLKTIGRFDSVARSGEIRVDGRVLLAGDDGGKMQVFDVAGGSRASVLKTWHIHKQPVWVARWSPTDLTTLMTASDDRTLRLWSLPEQDASQVFTGHLDYVRCGGFMPGSGAGSNLLVSGSYDSTVRIWDPRTGGSVLTFKHAAPVESVLPLSSGTTLLAAAGETISVLDLVAAKPMTTLHNHQKTVTCLSLASKGTRVVSGSLDGHAKIFDTSSWKVVAGFKYPSPILSLAVITAGSNDDDRHLAVGMQSGVLSIRTRLAGTSVAERDRTLAAQIAATATSTEDFAALDAARAKRKRGAKDRQRMDMVGEGVDVVIAGDERRRGAREKPWQRDLRHGRFARALDQVLDYDAKDAGPLNVLTLLVALRHRSALRDALAGRDEVTVQPVLKWISGHISDPRYVSVCVDVGLHLLNLYAEYVTGSAELANEFRNLYKRVRREVEKAQMACQTGGMVDSVLISATAV